MAYDLGDTVPLTVEIKNAAGALTNATTVTLTITQPDGTTVAGITITNPPAVTGRYVYDFVPTQAGRHTARWTSTGPTTAYVEIIDVRAATPGYIISLADAKAALNKIGTVDDEELRLYVEAATDVIERHLGEVVARRTVVERRRLTGAVDALALGQYPVISLTSVATADGLSTWDVAGLNVQANGILTVRTGRALSGNLVITYEAGRQAIPASYALAAQIVVAHLWETQRDQTLGWAPGSPANETIPQLGLGYVLPPKAIELLGHGSPRIA